MQQLAGGMLGHPESSALDRSAEANVSVCLRRHERTVPLLQKPRSRTINGAMAKTTREREQHAREGRLEHIRDQVSSGELVVRQMTDSERSHWDDHSVASDRQATPEERTRRDAARKKRRDRDKRNA